MEGADDDEMFNSSHLTSTAISDQIYTQQVASEQGHVSTNNEATDLSTKPHIFEVISTEESTKVFLRSH